MATVDMTSGTVGFVETGAYSSKPYFVERYLDFADAVVTKGSALADADVFPIIDVPAGTLVLAAGWEVMEEMTGTSTDLTFDFGITGGDVDAFVDGFDFDGASVGDWSSIPAATIGGKYLVTTADTLDILTETQTGTLTGGVLRVWAVLMDVNGRDKPGLAAAGA